MLGGTFSLKITEGDVTQMLYSAHWSKFFAFVYLFLACIQLGSCSLCGIQITGTLNDHYFESLLWILTACFYFTPPQNWLV